MSVFLKLIGSSDFHYAALAVWISLPLVLAYQPPSLTQVKQSLETQSFGDSFRSDYVTAPLRSASLLTYWLTIRRVTSRVLIIIIIIIHLLMASTNNQRFKRRWPTIFAQLVAVTRGTKHVQKMYVCGKHMRTVN